MESKGSSRLCNLTSIPPEEVLGTTRSRENIHQTHNRELPATLCHCTNLLHSPIYTIPFEILSHIFRGMVKPEDPLDPDSSARGRNLRQAFVLASVSTHFRDIALGTPELWQRILLSIPADEPTNWDKCSSLLRHCASYAHHLEVSVRATAYDGFPFITAEMIAEIFSSPVMNRKIKALELISLFKTDDGMLPFLASLPALDTFMLINEVDDDAEFRIDLSSLSLSRVAIFDTHSLEFISLPSTMEVLRLHNMHAALKLDFLKHCPNLVELVLDTFDERSKLDDPITLNHLKRLSTTTIHLGAMPLTNLQTSTLNFLNLGWSFENKEGGFVSVIPFCRQVSTSLTTLILDHFPETCKTVHFRLLFGLLPKLRNLGLRPRWVDQIVQPIYALQYQKDSCEDIYLPSLEWLVVGSHGVRFDHLSCFSDWCETSCFRLDFRVELSTPWAQFWLPRLRDKLRWISRGRQIEITHYNKRIEWLYE